MLEYNPSGSNSRRKRVSGNDESEKTTDGEVVETQDIAIPCKEGEKPTKFDIPPKMPPEKWAEAFRKSEQRLNHHKDFAKYGGTTAKDEYKGRE